MTTLYGTWQGTGYQARIYCVYSVSYTADHTQAIYAISFGAEFGASISDSVNTWAVSGDCGSATGSNIAYSIPSGGGSKIFRSGESAQKYGDAVVAGSIDNIEAIGGGQIVSTFTLASGPLAPYLTSTGYGVRNVGTSDFYTTAISASGNGGSINNVQLEVNYSASDSGAWYYSSGGWTDAHATGLNPNTLYYYRLRVSNNTYGYGAWGPWKSMATASTIPGPPSEGWYFRDVTQTSVVVDGLWYTTDGGSSIDLVLVRMNTSPTLSGYWDYNGGWEARAIGGLQPGTTYYACVYVHNANGWSAPTAWKSFTTLPGNSVNVGGVWKNAVCYVNVGGVWKPAVRYVAISNGAGGVNWKQ